MESSMIWQIIYIAGVIVSTSLFSWLVYKRQAQKYPSLANEDKYNDAIFAFVIGLMGSLMFPITLFGAEDC